MKVLKQALRQKTLRRLREQSPNSRQRKSLAIGKKLLRSPLYRDAKRLFCYAAIDGEVETRPILEKALSDGKAVFVPVVTDKSNRRMVVAQIKDLEKDLAHKGHYGVAHPLRLTAKSIGLKRLDLVIVPGIAFDRKGGRLGRGLGYFDRFLDQIPEKTPTVGLAFRCQVVGQIPSEVHDRPVDKLITE